MDEDFASCCFALHKRLLRTGQPTTLPYFGQRLKLAVLHWAMPKMICIYHELLRIKLQLETHWTQ